MPQEPLYSGRDRARSSFHALRMARRIERRTGRQPVGRISRQAQVRDRRTRVLVLLTMALGFELSAAALTSPLLGVERIALHGAELLPPAETALTERSVALQPGANLLRIPLGQMESRLKSLPWVQSARVRWMSPHALSVRFTARRPVVVATIGGRQLEVDETGVPIRIARPEFAQRLPHVDLERSITVRFGAPLNDEALLAAIDFYRDAPRQPMLRIAKIKVDPVGNMCLNMSDGIQVQMGQPEDLVAKTRYLQHIYELDPSVGRRLVAINLSVPKQPTCIPKSNILSGGTSSAARPPSPEVQGSATPVSL